ncbi:unannotated protein [freshwater metagenome]|uniref:Unannotated protein n=1 Tax=freshwater metagenome TaxID=449393 RepID=A0A6J6PIC6_9ZZZZ
MVEIIILVSAALLVGLIIFRLSKRGISKKYDRKPANPWSALNEGIDPSL